MDETQAESNEPGPENATAESLWGSIEPGTAGLVQKGAVVLTLLVLAVALFVAFQAVTEAISTWLEPRWVPIWRAGFAVIVAGLAVWVLRRLTAKAQG